jgi:disulfide bond formation protein DsbB
MHNYEVFAYIGVVIFALGLMFLVENPIINLIGILALVFALAKAFFHYTLHAHYTASPRRIKRMR